MIKTMIFTLSFLSKAKENFIWFTSTAWRGKSGRAAEGGAVEGQQNQLHNFLQGDKSNILTGLLLGFISFKCLWIFAGSYPASGFPKVKTEPRKSSAHANADHNRKWTVDLFNRNLENQPK